MKTYWECFFITVFFFSLIFFAPDFLISQYITGPIFACSFITIVWSVLFLIGEKTQKYLPVNLIVVSLASMIILGALLFTHRITIHIVFLLTLFSFFLLLVNSESIRKVGSRRLFYSAILCVNVLQILWGIKQFLCKETILGSFDNPAGFSICIAILSPFSLLLINRKQRFLSILAIVVLLTGYIAVWLSGSRTGIMAMTTSLCLYTFKSFFPKKRWGLFLIPLVALLFCYLFYLKINSAYGRLFIWERTLSMIDPIPLLDFAPGRFQAHYMLAQADFFANNSNEQFEILADNVYHPFNEYLKILIEFGWLPFVLVIILFAWSLWKFFRLSNIYLSPPLLSLISTGICAFFSYPFRYPVTWGILIFSISMLSVQFLHRIKIGKARWFLSKGCLWGLLGLEIITIPLVLKNVLIWSHLEYRQECNSKKIEGYALLYNYFKSDGIFLYDYAILLNSENRWLASINILKECTKYLNDTHVQLLLADNYIKTNNYIEAENALLLASHMCPNRFLPLYSLMSLYIKIGNMDKVKKVAILIVNKPIKINSPKIQKIVTEAHKFI